MINQPGPVSISQLVRDLQDEPVGELGVTYRCPLCGEAWADAPAQGACSER